MDKWLPDNTEARISRAAREASPERISPSSPGPITPDKISSRPSAVRNEDAETASRNVTEVIPETGQTSVFAAVGEESLGAGAGAAPPVTIKMRDRKAK